MIFYPKNRIFFAKLCLFISSQFILLSLFYKNIFLFWISFLVFLLFLFVYIWLRKLKIEITTTNFIYQTLFTKKVIKFSDISDWDIEIIRNYEGIKEPYLYLVSNKPYKLSLYQFREHKITIENHFRKFVGVNRFAKNNE